MPRQLNKFIPTKYELINVQEIIIKTMLSSAILQTFLLAKFIVSEFLNFEWITSSGIQKIYKRRIKISTRLPYLHFVNTGKKIVRHKFSNISIYRCSHDITFSLRAKKTTPTFVKLYNPNTRFGCT